MKAPRNFIFFGFFLGLVITAVLLVNSYPANGRDEVGLAPRTPDEQKAIDVYKRVNDAVVFITTITMTVDPFDFYQDVQPKEGTGSGVIVNASRGIIVTNLHVIQNAQNIEISLTTGSNHRARLLGFDKELDLAVLQINDPPRGLVDVPFGDSSQLEVGQRILAIGNPFALSGTLTMGVVSSLNRSVRNPNGHVMKGVIQTDAAINPGNSGGPLLDSAGRLIGINTAILSQSGDSAGISFAIPSNQIRRALPELVSTGKVLRPKIGWILEETTHGPMVRRVFPGSPAQEAGIQPFERKVRDVFLQGYIRDFSRADLVVAIDGTPIRTVDGADDIISRSDSKKSIEITLRSGGINGPERKVKVRPVLQ